MFTFWVRNERTKESAQFKGQGKSLEEAWKDANSNIRESFRPSSSGAPTSLPKLGVTLPAPPGGKSSIVMRAPEKFEGDEPYDAAKEFEATPTGTP